MSKWKRVKLKDISAVITKGTTPSNIGASFAESGIPYIKSEYLTFSDKYIVPTEPCFISAETHEKLKRSQLCSQDILLSMAGAYLGKSAILRDEDVPANTNQAVALIRIDSNQACPDFVYYFLNQKQLIAFMNQLPNQSAQPNINLAQIGSLEVGLPEIEAQKRTAGILSSYDKLIENNRRQIALLEEAAQRLYKEWFVDLRFPGYETTPIIDGLPEGWGKGSLFDLCTPIRGCSYSSEEVECGGGTLINLGNLAPYGGFRFGYEKPFSGKYRDDQLISKGDVFIGLTEQAKGLAGYAALAPAIPKGSVISADLMRLMPLEGVSSVYLYGLLRFGRLSDELSPLANGTKIKHLRPDAIARINFVVPPIPLINKYSDLVSPFFEKVSGLEEQIASAREARDRLLPKLISGEIEVV